MRPLGLSMVRALSPPWPLTPPALELLPHVVGAVARLCPGAILPVCTAISSRGPCQPALPCPDGAPRPLRQPDVPRARLAPVGTAGWRPVPLGGGSPPPLSDPACPQLSTLRLPCTWVVATRRAGDTSRRVSFCRVEASALASGPRPWRGRAFWIGSLTI